MSENNIKLDINEWDKQINNSLYGINPLCDKIYKKSSRINDLRRKFREMGEMITQIKSMNDSDTKALHNHINDTIRTKSSKTFEHFNLSFNDEIIYSIVNRRNEVFNEIQQLLKEIRNINL